MISSQDLVALSTIAAYDRSVKYGSIVYGVDGHQLKLLIELQQILRQFW